MPNTFRWGVAAVTALFISAGAAAEQHELAKLLADDGAGADRFGCAVAIDGNTAVIGAYQGNNSTIETGSAYVFVRGQAGWTQQTELLALDGALADHFGGAVAIYEDTIVVGAALDDDNGDDSGAAYVFQRTGGVWSQEQRLLPDDGAAGDRFGNAVAVWGNTVVVGAIFHGGAGYWAGAAYVFEKRSGTWTQRQKLQPADLAMQDGFGRSVAIRGDTILVGADVDDDKGDGSGSVYVFQRNGTTWVEQAKLTANDGSAGDFFGFSVALSADSAAIGAVGESDKGTTAGAAYVFRRNGSNWVQQGKLLASDGAVEDNFGWTVSIAGNTCLVGAYNAGNSGPSAWDGRGAAYVFRRAGGHWTQHAKLLPSDIADNDEFGGSVSISGDRAIIGASEDDDAGSSSGSAYVFSMPTDGGGRGCGLGASLPALAACWILCLLWLVTLKVRRHRPCR